jgi:hypothetical protein
MAVNMNNSNIEALPRTPGRGLSFVALDRPNHFGGSLLIFGRDEVRNAGGRDDESEFTSRLILSLHRTDGSIGWNRSRSSSAMPDVAASNASCSLWACGHHGRSDHHIHTDGLDRSFPVLCRRDGSIHCVWPLSPSADSITPDITQNHSPEIVDWIAALHGRVLFNYPTEGDRKGIRKNDIRRTLERGTTRIKEFLFSVKTPDHLHSQPIH